MADSPAPLRAEPLASGTYAEAVQRRDVTRWMLEHECERMPEPEPFPVYLWSELEAA